MLMCKSLSLSDCELKFAASEGRFSGYGSVFGNVDDRGHVIAPGAYADVLASGAPVDVYVNHGWLRDELPIGRWENLQEDVRGLKGEAGLVMQMHAASDAYWAMRSGLVTGLSVAILPDPKATERRPDGTRVVHRVKALKEISVVTEPANDLARVTDIKSAADLDAQIAGIDSVRDFERFLRDAGGLSKGVAVALAARARDLFASEGDPAADDEQAKLLRRIEVRAGGIAVRTSA